MKRTWTFTLVVLTLVVASCNQQQPDSTNVPKVQEPGKFTPEDSAFLAGWYKFANKMDTGIVLFNHPVPRSLVAKCTKAFNDIFTTNPPNCSALNFTDYVAFNSIALKDWFVQFNVWDRSTIISVEFGIYTKEVITALNGDLNRDNDIDPKHEGRLTIFICPYQSVGVPARVSASGAEIEPFNLGSLHP